MVLRRLCVSAAAGLLSACNMVISGTPIFAEADRADRAPRDGIWLEDNDECRFDPATPESAWPGCAVWVIVRGSGRELEISDGKKQSQHLRSLFASGAPGLVELRWVDDAKDPGEIFHGYYAYEPHPRGLMECLPELRRGRSSAGSRLGRT